MAMNIPVKSRIGGSDYQKLYQKGFRAGRKYQLARLEPELDELTASNETLRGNITNLLNRQAEERAELEKTKRLDILSAVVWTVIGTWVVSFVALMFMPALFLIAGGLLAIATLYGLVNSDR